MGAVWSWVRAELRAHRRAWLGLALLLGLGAGAVTAAAAGARRTDSAYDRFLAAHDAADVFVFDDGFFGVGADLDEIVRLPQVASWARGSVVTYLKGTVPGIASVDGALGTSINRLEVLEGRMYNPEAIDEVVVGFGAARQQGLHVGSTFPLFEPEIADLAASFGLENTTLEVVGIVAGPGGFPPQYAFSLHLTPAFFDRYGNYQVDEPGDATHRGTLFINLERGLADAAAFKAAVSELAPGGLEAVFTSEDLGELTEKAFHVQALALWLLAAAGAIATALVVGQVLVRHMFLASTEFGALGALGMSRGQLTAVGLVRTGIIAVAGSAIACVVAVALSPLTPLGDARIAEPEPGVVFDGAALGAAFLAIVVVTLLIGAVPAWRAAASGGERARSRPSLLATSAARAGLPAPFVAATRLALETGTGPTALPVRSTLAGVTVGVACLAAAVVFGSSLDHLIATPRLYGVQWDTFVTHYGDGNDLRTQLPALRRLDGVRGLSIGGSGQGEIMGAEVPIVAVRSLRGAALPPIVRGRAPASPTEIAVGGRTLGRTGVTIGDTLTLTAAEEGARPTTYAVVGQTVIAPGNNELAAGEGALLTIEGLGRLGPLNDERLLAVSDAYLVFEPGSDRTAVLRELAAIAGIEEDPTLGEIRPRAPEDIVNFGRVQSLPALLGGIIGLVAVGALAHTVVSSVRRRRRDIAILKTLGFVGRQVRAAVAWQATLLTTIALVIGVPTGIALGRWLWLLLAEQLGMVPEAAIRVPVVALLVPGALLLANLVATLPGRVAARIEPAVALRAE